MSILGTDTITIDDSPEGQESEIAVETENEEQQTNELETEQSESEESESPPAGQGEDLILGKFKNNDELAKAYSELQKQFTQSRQQPAQQQQQNQQQVQQEQVDYNEIFYERFNQDPLGTLEFLVNNVVNQKTAPIFEKEQMATLGKNIEAITKEYKQVGTEDGMTALRQKIGEISQDLGNPKLADNPSPRVLKMAALELWGDSKAQMYTKAKEQGRQEAEASRQAKLGVTAIGVTKKPNEAPKSEADHIIDGMMAASGKRGLFG